MAQQRLEGHRPECPNGYEPGPNRPSCWEEIWWRFVDTCFKLRYVFELAFWGTFGTVLKRSA